jgi:UDP-N-acetylglucosamine--dolichyl-phosphate N-acetylglucosaminephosphotransferase
MLVLILISIFSFFSSLILTRCLINYFKRNNIVALDLHKKGKPKRANSGGLPISLSIIYALLVFVSIQIAIFNETEQLVYLFASVLSIFLITIIGFLDDLDSTDVATGKRKKRVGIKQWIKPLLTLSGAIPLMAVSAGETIMSVPFFGPIDFGGVYPIILIPLAVVFTSNAVNLLGGFNGSEAGMGLVYCFFLGLIALKGNQMVAAAIFFSTFSALIGFLIFNRYPAKILPGDSLTYCLGAVVVSGVIVGNMERAGIIIMFPFFIEFLLKLRSKFKASCLGKLRKDGKLDPPYGKKIYSWTHIIMNLGKLTEQQVAMALILIEMLFGLLLLL